MSLPRNFSPRLCGIRLQVRVSDFRYIEQRHLEKLDLQRGYIMECRRWGARRMVGAKAPWSFLQARGWPRTLQNDPNIRRWKRVLKWETNVKSKAWARLDQPLLPLICARAETVMQGIARLIIEAWQGPGAIALEPTRVEHNRAGLRTSFKKNVLC